MFAGLDACARLVPIIEDCLSHYIPQVFPILFFNETVDAGKVCGGGSSGGGGGGPHCINAAPGMPWQCTPNACSCSKGQKKLEHTFGNPPTVCWSCETSPTGDNYDDDDREGVDLVDLVDLSSADRVAGGGTGPDTLPQAPWTPGSLRVPAGLLRAFAADVNTHADSATAADSTAAGNMSIRHSGMDIPAGTHVDVAVDMAFVPWNIIKHAGWNEPCNRYVDIHGHPTHEPVHDHGSFHHVLDRPPSNSTGTGTGTARAVRDPSLPSATYDVTYYVNRWAPIPGTAPLSLIFPLFRTTFPFT